MRTLLKALLILIISIIVIAIALAAYIMIKNPLGLRDVFVASYIKDNSVLSTVNNVNNADNIPASSTYDHPLLNDEQEAMAAKAGIDVSKLPSEITPEQQQCVNSKLGEARVLEIIKGAEPSPLEMIKVVPCF
ncbi:hypothetical protein JXE04_01095 [Patescibacteria group bacterium]|nr:hypothetical protein [Patescibacteria group bacterium]